LLVPPTLLDCPLQEYREDGPVARFLEPSLDQGRPTPDALLTTRCFLALLLRGHTRHDLAHTQDSPLLDALIKYHWFQTLEADSEQTATSSLAAVSPLELQMELRCSAL